MSSSPPPLRWWGWGERSVEVPSGLLQLLNERCGISGAAVSQAPELSSVRVPDAAPPGQLRTQLVSVCGTQHVRDDLEERIRHAAGRSYLDLLQLRAGELPAAPDLVVHPQSPAEVRRVLELCAEHGCAVVPFGGGTSVVGGVTCAASPSLALDLDGLDALTAFDSRSLLATLQAGMRGPAIERALTLRGATLGHFPQSFEYATAGGFAATRSAGQASAGYGRFDDMVRGVSFAAPSGAVDIAAEPPSATGPSLLQTILGSEGALGVITDVTVRVRARPKLHRHVGYSFPDFEFGTEAFRVMAQRGELPDVARLSDAEESRASLAMSAGNATRVAQRYLALRGHRDPCLAIVGWDGDGWDVGRRARELASIVRRHGAIALGSAPGSSWRRSRFEAPYLRDALLDRSVLAETLETATVWSSVHELRRAVRDALLRSLGTAASPLIGCHISHVYPEGASLYFTVLGAQATDPMAQWRAAKAEATEAMIASGGVVSHHHGIGRDHVRWLHSTRGDVAAAALRALKQQWDPAGVMNPGVLLQP